MGVELAWGGKHGIFVNLTSEMEDFKQILWQADKSQLLSKVASALDRW